MSAATPLIAVAFGPTWTSASPRETAEAARTLDAAGADLIILGGAAPGLDPLVLAAWLVPQVKRAGIVAAIPALNAFPFHVARALSALDILTRGRAGWAPTMLGHAEQPDGPAKAVDFIDATCALWDSWDAEALVIDKASGVYLDPAHVRRVHYRGPWFQVMGPLNAARPPQGYPVLVQSDADPLWRATAPCADFLLIERPDAATLADRRAELARVGGQARLLATVDVDDDRTFELGALADGVHFAPTDPGAVIKLTEVISALRGDAPTPRATGSLRSRLGLADHKNSGPAHRFIASEAA